jgi:hypothetical protein
LRCANAEGLPCLPKAFAQIEGNGLDFELSRFDLREVQDVVDDGKQVLRGEANQSEVLSLFDCEVGVQDKFGHSRDAFHRRTNFMAHGCEQRALCLIRFLCNIFGESQLLRALFLSLPLAQEVWSSNLHALANLSIGQLPRISLHSLHFVSGP